MNCYGIFVTVGICFNCRFLDLSKGGPERDQALNMATATGDDAKFGISIPEDIEKGGMHKDQVSLSHFATLNFIAKST